MYNYGSQPKSPQQLQQELQQEMAKYQQMYGLQQQYQPQPQQATNGGRYIYVNSYDEVVNAPTSTDGNSTLFVYLEKGLMWSKKFQEGQHFIQAFTFAPLNSVGEPKAKEQPKSQENDYNALNERISVLESILKGKDNE